MRKTIKRAVALGVGSIISMLLLKPSFSADNASVDVVMTIQSVSIVSLSASSVAIAAPFGGSRVTERVVFKNDGNGNENFSVKITSTTGNWTLTQNSPGANEYRLSAIWHYYDIKPLANEFQANDILFPEGTYKDSSDTVLFNDTDPHSTETVKGFNVSVDGQRNLFFKFDSPTSGSGNARAHVNVSATTVP